jgi:hypothetical protein
MSEKSYYAGAYWGRRPESAQQCARRAETFFRLLAECDPGYARWFEQANSLKRALQLQFEPTFDTFVRFFGMKKNQILDNGFSFSAWTGHVEKQHGGVVSLRCGSVANVAPNSVLLYLPKEAPGSEHVLTAPMLTRVMRAMVLAWEPDWAVVTNDDLQEHLSRNGAADTFVGWLTYISRQWGEVPALPEPVRVEPLEGKGTLVVLTPERLSAANPEHLDLGRRVQQVLEERGLLRRLLPQRQ